MKFQLFLSWTAVFFLLSFSLVAIAGQCDAVNKGDGNVAALFRFGGSWGGPAKDFMRKERSLLIATDKQVFGGI